MRRQKVLLMGVAGGKLSEGVEIVRNGHSLISTVIFAGLPFIRQTSDKMVIQDALTKAAKDGKVAREFMRNIPLSRKVVQAFGRTVRQHLDRGALIILDYRAEKTLRKELQLIKFISIKDVNTRLDKFFADYLTLEEIH